MLKHKVGDIVILGENVDVDRRGIFRPGVVVKIKSLWSNGVPENEHYTVHTLNSEQGCWRVVDSEIKEETKVMKPTDKISVEVSLAELAEIYLAMGTTRTNTTYELWDYACELLDPTQEKADQLIGKKDEEEVLNFRSYQDEIKRVMFPEPVEQKSPQQIQIEALQETINRAAMQIKLLKEGN